MMNEFMIHDGKLNKYIGQNNNVVIPEGVTTIDYEAFRGRRNLTNIVIPEGVKYIHYGAFAGCQKLGQIRIPSSVTGIAVNAFSGCTDLMRIDVDENNDSYLSVDGIVYSKDGTELCICPGALEHILIRKDVKSIKIEVLHYCTKLKSIEVEKGNKHFSAIDGALYDYTGKTLVTCPRAKNRIRISSGIKEISQYAFSGCDRMIVEGKGLFERERDGSFANHVDPKGLTPEQLAEILLNQKKKEWIALYATAVKYTDVQQVFDLLADALQEKKKLSNPVGKNIAEAFVANMLSLSKDCNRKIYALLCEKSPATKEFLDKNKCGEIIGQFLGETQEKWIIEDGRIIGVNGRHKRIDLPNDVAVSKKALEHVDVEIVHIQAKNATIDLEWLKTARFADSVKRLEVHPTWLASLIQKNVGFKTVAGGMEENPKLAEIEFSDDVKSRLVFVKEKVNAHYEAMAKIAIRNIGMDIHEVLEIFSEKMSLTMKASFLMKELEATVNSVVLPDDVSIQAYDQIAQQLEANRVVVSLANMLFGGRLENIRFADTQESAPAIAVEYLLLSFMAESKRNAAVGCREMQLIGLLDKKQIQEMLEEKFDIRDNSTATPDTSCVLPFVCRLCGVKQAVHLNALYNQYARKDLMEIGIRGRIRAGLAQYLPYNESNDILLALDKHKNGLFSQAAKLRGMTEEDLRNDLQTFADNMLDSNGQMVLNYGAHTFTITLMPDMTITIWDQEKKKYCKSLPKAGKTDNAEQAAQAAESLKQLKNNVKNLSAQRAKGVQEMLQTGGTIRARSWKTRFLKSTIVRTMATGVLWGVYGEKDTLCCAFAVDGNERCTDINGAEISLTDDTQIGVVDAAQLSEEALEAWRTFFWKKGTKAVVRQFEAPARYIPAEFIEDRYMGLTVSVGYARAATGYDPYSDDPEAYIDGKFIDVSAIAQDRHQDTGELLVEDVRVSRDMPDFDDMTDHQKRLLNRDLIRLDSVLHPEKKAAEIVATGSQGEVKILADTKLITPDNITQMLGVAIDKKNTDAVSYLMQLKQDWLGDVNDPFAEFTLD